MHSKFHIISPVPALLGIALTLATSGPAQAAPQLVPTIQPTTPMTPDEDPRDKLVEWMTASDNPYFARTLVNRYWKHLMGRGLVDPEDDFDPINISKSSGNYGSFRTHYCSWPPPAGNLHYSRCPLIGHCNQPGQMLLLVSIDILMIENDSPLD